ncbi:hypothetical protein OZX56_01080 [Lactobacillus sp. ESL0684]|uniref:hypothetical protein n=1 Tax=Lactobacillus sp. ESL0684 TaxID=2983213 RepID=UPI0023F677DB|nr:hypothetical protein [Lactobacillus sp. ESL0684]WEV43862.1 hypothetical protein OZX56_01080 [Lactobacillus sp. ESL0684]
MLFFKKIRAFISFYFSLALDNKLTFVFTLVFPIIYQLLVFKNKPIVGENQFISSIMPMVAYIVVDTALNGVTLRMIATRESGYIKAYYFASGSRWAIYLANMLVQLFMVVLENLIFIILSMLYFNFFSFKILLALLCTVFISFPFVSLGFNFLLLLRIRGSSLSILSTALLLGFLMLFNATFNLPLKFVYLFNPYTLVAFLLEALFSPSVKLWIYIGTVFLIYGLVGYLGYSFFDLQNRGHKE